VEDDRQYQGKNQAQDQSFRSTHITSTNQDVYG
jgi:hypothetical protein